MSTPPSVLAQIPTYLLARSPNDRHAIALERWLRDHGGGRPSLLEIEQERARRKRPRPRHNRPRTTA